MTLYLSYENSQGLTKTVWLLPHQSLLIGQGSQCDLVCDFDRQMAGQHFQLAYVDGFWTVRTLAGAVQVDSRQISGNTHTLQQNCLIQAGNTEFRVTIEGAGNSAAQQTPQPVPISAPTAPLQWTRQSPLCLAVSWDQSRYAALLQKLSEKASLFAAINQMRLKQPVAGIKVDGPDLYEQAPEEIRATDSLHLVQLPADQLEACTSGLLLASRSDGLCLLVAPLPIEQLKEEMKILWAWFSRPSIFQFHLENGSKFLTERLLATPRCIIVSDRKATDRLLLFASAANSRTAEQLLVELSNSSQVNTQPVP